MIQALLLIALAVTLALAGAMWLGVCYGDDDAQ